MMPVSKKRKKKYTVKVTAPVPDADLVSLATCDRVIGDMIKEDAARGIEASISIITTMAHLGRQVDPTGRTGPTPAAYEALRNVYESEHGVEYAARSNEVLDALEADPDFSPFEALKILNRKS